MVAYLTRLSVSMLNDVALCESSGRYLRIVYTERSLAGRPAIRPVSARDMTASERARYVR